MEPLGEEEQAGDNPLLKAVKAKGTRFVALNQVLAALTQLQRIRGHYENLKAGVLRVAEDPITATELIAQIGGRPEVLQEILGEAVGVLRQNIGPV